LYPLTAPLLLTTAVTLRSDKGAGVTVIDGQGDTTTNRCVVISNEYATVQGFTVVGGLSTGEGGGILVSGGIVRDCVITSNSAASGGGLFIRNGKAVDCTISDNTAGTGGGVAFSQVASLRKCMIIGNHASIGGGVFMKDGSEQMVENCKVLGNTAEDRGGGVNTWNNGTVNNCLIVGNTASNSGGGVNTDWNWSGVRSAYFNNCTIADNWAATDGGLASSFSGAVMRNCIVDGNANGSADDGYDMAYCCIQTAGSGVGIVTNAPRFIDPTAGDYRLMPTSPCIEAGTNMDWMYGATDIEGNPRIINRRADIGACEFAGLSECDFAAPVRSGPESVIVTFDGISLSGTNASVPIYFWDFNDDGTWDMQGPDLTHVTNTYTNYGFYSVTLMVSNLAGQVLATTKRDYVKVGPAVVYVSLAGGHVPPFGDWVTAATNLQDAVDLGADGSVVLMTNDTYVLPRRVRIVDGIELRGLNPEEETTLDGKGVSSGVYIDHPGAVVSGLTITNCTADGLGEDGAGGAVFIGRGGTVRNCTLGGNRAASNGGGVCLLGGGMVSNCLIIGNSALSGAGVYFAFAGQVVDSTISNNVSRDQGGGAFMEGGGDLYRNKITCNTAPRRGGGVFTAHLGDIHDCEITGNTSRFGGGIFSYYNGSSQRCGIWNCRIANNTVSDFGGGVSLAHGGYWSGSIRNCLIVGNSAANGGGVDVTTYGEIFNCTIVDNTASGKGGGVHGHFFGGSENAWVYDTIIVSNRASTAANYYMCSYDHCCTQPAVTGGGNMTNDPQFVNALAGDYHLAASSPCKDSAGSRSWMETGSDLDDHPRITGGVADRGCYEFALGQGSVSGILIPNEATVDGGRWQLINGPDTGWRNSDAVISGLPPGTYTVGYRSIGAGWVTPPRQLIDVVPGQSTVSTGRYTRCGSALCVLVPSVVRGRGARWRLTGGPDMAWQESDALVTNLPPGLYGMTFNTVGGWTSPSDRPIVIGKGQTTNIVASYSPWGDVSFLIESRAAREGGAHWRLTTGYDTSWQESGSLVTNLPPGPYTVSFEPVSGLNAPLDVQVDVIDGTVNYQMASYLSYCGIYCVIEPKRARAAGARWQLMNCYNSGWMESYSTITNLAPGDYTLTFQHVDGWLEPVDRTVTVARDQDTSLTVSYGEPVLHYGLQAFLGESYFVVYWDSPSGWAFSLYSTTNLLSPQWVTNRYQVPGQGGQTSYLEHDLSIRNLFFRMEAERQY
jgi:hypothetical protein